MVSYEYKIAISMPELLVSICWFWLLVKIKKATSRVAFKIGIRELEKDYVEIILKRSSYFKVIC